MLDGLRHPEPAEADPLAELTPQERGILDHIAEGMTNRQIGEAMFLAEKTVKNYVSNLLDQAGHVPPHRGGRLCRPAGRAPPHRAELMPLRHIDDSERLRHLVEAVLSSAPTSRCPSRSAGSSRRR